MTTGSAFRAEKIKIGYLRIVNSLSTLVALEKGRFKQEGVKVEVIPFESSTLVIDALMTGRIDTNCCCAITGFWFAARGAPDRFKIFLAYGTPSQKNPAFM